MAMNKITGKIRKILIYILFIFSPLVAVADVLSGKEFGVFISFLSWLFKFGFGTAVILSVLMIVIGGIEFIFSAVNVEKRSDAKKRINYAIFGLLLAAMSWLILYTINPDLTKLSLDIESVSTGGEQRGGSEGGGGEGSGQPPSQEWTTVLADDGKTRNFLKENFIFINKGACPTSYTNTNCTMVSELPQNAIDGVIKIKKESKATITITGGTEIGVHQSHGPNVPNLDLRYTTELLKYMHNEVGLTQSEGMTYNKFYTATDGSFRVMWEKNEKGVEHFHVEFK